MTTPDHGGIALKLCVLDEAATLVEQSELLASGLDQRALAIMLAVDRGTNGNSRADDVAARLKYKPARSGRLAVTGTLRRLERLGYVGRNAPRDQWSAAAWFLMPKAKKYIASLRDVKET